MPFLLFLVFHAFLVKPFNFLDIVAYLFYFLLHIGVVCADFLHGFERIQRFEQFFLAEHLFAAGVLLGGLFQFLDAGGGVLIVLRQGEHLLVAGYCQFVLLVIFVTPAAVIVLLRVAQVAFYLFQQFLGIAVFRQVRQQFVEQCFRSREFQGLALLQGFVVVPAGVFYAPFIFGNQLLQAAIVQVNLLDGLQL